MSPLQMRLKSTTCNRISLEGAVPDRWLDLTMDKILAWPIEVDRRPATIGEVFDVCDGMRDQWLLSGDLQHCDFIAAGMRSGEIVVDGCVGNFLASGMRGGSVTVRGDAGTFAASSLRDGSVTIQGNVASYAASPAPEQSQGMSGGQLVVHGNADQWLASRLRRGLVIVHGSVESGCATRMIAGTLVVGGRVELPFGCGMSRGTVLLLAPQAEVLTHGLVGFTSASPCELSFLPLLLQQVMPLLPAPLAEGLIDSRWNRCLGDRAESGVGEVFWRSPAEQRLGFESGAS